MFFEGKIMMLDLIISYVALFALVWMFPYGYYLVVYSIGDRKHVNYLVDNLAAKPEKFKKSHHIAMASFGSGGIFSLFCVIYPFVRHRRKEKKITFDIFMVINWLFFMVIFISFLSLKLKGI